MDKNFVHKKFVPEYAKPYPIPLLVQGTPVLSCNAGDVREQSFTTATGRGRVYAVDVFNSQRIGVYGTSQKGGRTSLIIGGQSIFDSVSSDVFSGQYTADVYGTTYTPITVNEAQTGRLILDQTNADTGSINTSQVLFYYTNDSHNLFVANNSYRNSGFGQKRLAFNLPILAGTQAPVVLEKKGVVPKNLGQITAVQLSLGNVGASNLQVVNGFITLELAIDGVVVIENVNAFYFAVPSFKRPQIFIVNVVPGSTYEIRAKYAGTGTLNSRLDVNLIFYFGN